MEPKLIERRAIADERGWLCEVVRQSGVGEIAQVYVTTCVPGVVKGWHRHALQTDRLCCVHGMARVVTCEPTPDLEESIEGYKQHWWGIEAIGAAATGKGVEGPVPPVTFKTFTVGPESPGVVVISPGLWHAFHAVGPGPCTIINCTDREYDGTDEERLDLDAIPFEWWGAGR